MNKVLSMFWLTHLLRMKMELEGDLQPIPEDSDAEWDMIEEVFNSFLDETNIVLIC